MNKCRELRTARVDAGLVVGSALLHGGETWGGGGGLAGAEIGFMSFESSLQISFAKRDVASSS